MIVSSKSISGSTQVPRASAAMRSRCSSSFLAGRPRRGFPVTGSTGRGGRNDISDLVSFGGNRSGCSSRSASDGRPRMGFPVLGSIGIVVSFVWKFSIYLVDFCWSKEARYSVEILGSPGPGRLQAAYPAGFTLGPATPLPRNAVPPSPPFFRDFIEIGIFHRTSSCSTITGSSPGTCITVIAATPHQIFLRLRTPLPRPHLRQEK